MNTSNQEFDFDSYESAFVINKDIKTKGNDKVYCNEAYAQKLYNLYTGSGAPDPVPEIGEKVEATIINSLEDGSLTLDYGGKYSLNLKIDSNEIRHLHQNINDGIDYGEDIHIGDKIKVAVAGWTKDKGSLKASVYELDKIDRKNHLESIVNTDESIEVEVVSMNKYGYTVVYGGIEMFMSHYNTDVNKVPQNRRYDLIGRKVKTCVVTEFGRNGLEYQANRKKYLEALKPKMEKSLERGKIYVGMVTGTTKYGIFVQFAEVLTGLIHKDVIDENVDINLVNAGDEIEFYYQETAPGGKNILTQQWRESVWDEVEVGDVYDGDILDIKSSGVLVRLDWNTIGMINNKELERKDIELSPGENVTVRVVWMNRSNKKLSLSFITKNKNENENENE